jgi:glycosyltransferase involved in cell wall biosynthesis
MEILHVSGAKIWGGNEQQMEYIVNYISENSQFKQSLLCYQDTPLSNRAKEWNIKVFDIKKHSVFSPKYWKSFYTICKKIDAKIVHIHTSDTVTGFMLTDIFYNLKLKAIYSKKGLSRKMTFLSRIKYAYKGFDKIIFVSEIVKNYFQNLLPDKIQHKFVVIPDGFKLDTSSEIKINLKEKLNLKHDIKIIAHVGNHTQSKNIPLLIELTKILSQQEKFNFIVLQFGKKSELTSKYENLVKSKKLNSFIKFMGFTKDLQSFYNQFDAFVITSSKEGGPSCLFEAFYHKVPVVSTNVGVVKEASKDNTAALICQAHDIQCLSHNLIEIITNQSFSKQLIDNAYKTVINDYTTDTLGKKHLKIYSELLKA